MPLMACLENNKLKVRLPTKVIYVIFVEINCSIMRRFMFPTKLCAAPLLTSYTRVGEFLRTRSAHRCFYMQRLNTFFKKFHVAISSSFTINFGASIFPLKLYHCFLDNPLSEKIHFETVTSQLSQHQFCFYRTGAIFDF